MDFRHAKFDSFESKMMDKPKLIFGTLIRILIKGKKKQEMSVVVENASHGNTANMKG